MQPAICLLSVVPVRKEPSHRSEMVSQLLFGEYVTMGEEKDDFVAVQCLHDGYRGWVQTAQLTPVTAQQLYSTNRYISNFAAEVLVDGRCRMVPFGTPVYAAENTAESLLLGNCQVAYKVPDEAVRTVTEKFFSEESLHKLIRIYSDAPYLWGGRSVWGTDCSGFVQQVFKLFGVQLLRDAYLQAEQGSEIKTLSDAVSGDLVFFQNDKGQVMHVGILLANNQIVHASGRVRIDGVDNDGIVNHENGKRTHRFHSIRQFF